MSKTTTETVTDSQIRALRIEAAQVGDWDQEELCFRALGEESPVREPGIITDRVLGADRAMARDLCARAIAAAEAQDA